ncbi:MAG TPA: histidine phosphatase family protein [Pseudolysinimonas sp.]|nr:histidine phosphatase family protein [Pseudolysinimonas sp.]
MRLLLIRHGQTPANVRGELETARPGPPLTKLGEEQAAAIPTALAHETIDAIYVSPLSRTHLTAAPLARALNLEPMVIEGIEEIEAGELEGRADKEAVWAYLETVFGWLSGDLDRAMPGGPDGARFFERFDGALRSIAERHPEDATVAVVSHGGAIRVWTGARGKNLGEDFTSRTILDNTGVVVLIGSPDDGWIVETWGGEPVGGEALHDDRAKDPTGEQTR